MKSLFILSVFSVVLFANPYPDPKAVPKDPLYKETPTILKRISAEELRNRGSQVIRVDISWHPTEIYKVERIAIENSGTEAFVARSTKKPALGSYLGELQSKKNPRTIYYDSVGTGSELRLLTRGMTFRFPMQEELSEFTLAVEDPKTGKMLKTLTVEVDPKDLKELPTISPEIREMKKATLTPALKFNIYSDGYVPSRGGTSDAFFASAKRVVETLQKNKFPGFERFEIVAVFVPSKVALGTAKNLGLPVKTRDSFLGLYYPYWNNFGRWYNIVYPTSESKFRDGVGIIPYDYPLILIDNADYWGIGNFNVFTAIPTRHSAFTYLLTHELGHFFGLNEEYEMGGRTELAFSPAIEEPWSQNITFHPKRGELKWEFLVDSATKLPTPHSEWGSSGPLGAYRGGYAQTEPFNKSHKPGNSCTMSSGTRFCAVCEKAMNEKIDWDTGH